MKRTPLVHDEGVVRRRMMLAAAVGALTFASCGRTTRSLQTTASPAATMTAGVQPVTDVVGDDRAASSTEVISPGQIPTSTTISMTTPRSARATTTTTSLVPATSTTRLETPRTSSRVVVPETPADTNPTRQALDAIAPSLPECRSTDLSASVLQSSDFLTSGNGYALVSFSNQSSNLCRVQGTPHVTAFDVDGVPLPLSVIAGDYETVDPPVDANPVALLAGQEPGFRRGNAGVLLTWPSFRGKKCSAQPAVVGSMDFGIAADQPPVHVAFSNPVSSGRSTLSPVAPCGGQLAVQSFQPSSEPGTQ